MTSKYNQDNFFDHKQYNFLDIRQCDNEITNNNYDCYKCYTTDVYIGPQNYISTADKYYLSDIILPYQLEINLLEPSDIMKNNDRPTYINSITFYDVDKNGLYPCLKSYIDLANNEKDASAQLYEAANIQYTENENENMNLTIEPKFDGCCSLLCEFGMGMIVNALEFYVNGNGPNLKLSYDINWYTMDWSDYFSKREPNKEPDFEEYIKDLGYNPMQQIIHYEINFLPDEHKFKAFQDSLDDYFDRCNKNDNSHIYDPLNSTYIYYDMDIL